MNITETRRPRSGLKVVPRITNPKNLSPELKLPLGGGGGNNQFPTFDVESKFAKILKSHYGGEEGGKAEKFLSFCHDFTLTLGRLGHQ